MNFPNEVGFTAINSVFYPHYLSHPTDTNLLRPSHNLRPRFQPSPSATTQLLPPLYHHPNAINYGHHPMGHGHHRANTTLLPPYYHSLSAAVFHCDLACNTALFLFVLLLRVFGDA